MTELKEFMLLFRSQPINELPTPAQLQEMQGQWGKFIGGIAMQGKLVSTYQLGFEGTQIFADHTTQNGLQIAEGKTMTGNLVLKAESLEVATELAKNCPILLVGGTVEVRSTIPMN
jgi:hypothetical protein